MIFQLATNLKFFTKARALTVTVQPPSGQDPGTSSPKPPLSSQDAAKQQQTDEILNSVLPPREWNEAGQLWIQQVSRINLISKGTYYSLVLSLNYLKVASTPATRLDVVTLQEELDKRLQQRQARETGICPVRRELYSQCFGKLYS